MTARVAASPPRSSPAIVHLIPADGIGGVEVAARSMLAHRSDDGNFRLMLIAGGSMVPSARVIPSRFAGLNNPVAHLAALCTLLRLKPDVLICSLWRSVPAAVLTKILRPRIRLVLFLHLDRPMHLLDRVLTRLGLVLADEIWADSDQTLAARRLPAATSTRVVSFVTDRLAPAAPAPVVAPRFVCWARIVPQKGFDRAIELIRLLVAGGIDAGYDIYGPDGGARAALERQVEAAGLARHITFHGPIERARLPLVAAQSSFFLQLSRFEGLGMGVVEAMQLGLVPVTTPAGQIARYVDASTGIRVDPADLPAAAARIAALLDDPDGYSRLRDAAIDYWRAAPLYADHILAYARSLAGGKPPCR